MVTDGRGWVVCASVEVVCRVGAGSEVGDKVFVWQAARVKTRQRHAVVLFFSKNAISGFPFSAI
jgi:hypothetical protein